MCVSDWAAGASVPWSVTYSSAFRGVGSSEQSPEGAENMQLSGQFITAVPGEKRKHMAGQHNAADHGADHAQKNQPCQCCLA